MNNADHPTLYFRWVRRRTTVKRLLFGYFEIPDQEVMLQQWWWKNGRMMLNEYVGLDTDSGEWRDVQVVSE